MPLGAARFGLLGGVADLGKLELIETKSITSSTNSMDFLSIQESTYNVHFLTYNNFRPETNADRLGLRFFESGTLETASVYQYANQLGRAGGTFTDTVRSTADNHIFLGTNIANTATNSDSGYCYFYNLGDNTKYSFTTSHTTGMYYNTPEYSFFFGSGVLPQTSTVDGIRLLIGNSPARNIANLQASLYGIAES
jgi:hypothetical protein